MTEPIGARGGLAVADPAAGLLSPELDDTAGDDNRRKLAAVAAAVGVLVLLVVAFFLLKGGGSNNAAGPVAPHIVPPVAGSTTTATTAHQPAATKPVKLLKSFSGPIGRDPFKPLYTQPTQAAAPTGTTANPAGGTVTSTPGSTVGGSTGTTPPVVAVPASFAPVWVELVSVKGTRSASFIVGYSNGKHSKTMPFADVVAPTHSLRTTFASVFALLSIQDHTATVQFGDGRPFDLATGFGNRHFVG